MATNFREFKRRQSRTTIPLLAKATGAKTSHSEAIQRHATPADRVATEYLAPTTSASLQNLEATTRFLLHRS